MSSAVSTLFPEKVRNKEPDIGGPFRQPAHEIRIPLRAEWNIYAHGISLLGEAFLQVTTNPIKHLEFQSMFRVADLLGVLFCKCDAMLIVRGDGRHRGHASIV